MNFPTLPPTKTTVMERLLRVSCWLTLLALGLMCWSVLDPRPIPVIAAMMGGQAVGTLAFFLYVVVLAGDLYRSRVFDKRVRE